MPQTTERLTAKDFDQELLDIYDYYVHGKIDRRTFLDRAAKFAVGGLTAMALLEMLSPNYALAAQVPKEDARVKSEYLKYPSPNGNHPKGEMQGLFAKPANARGKLSGVIVVHENRGLNPYVEDVARRLALAGFVAFAPDALYASGGYPGNDEQGREMQAKLDRNKITEDFMAASQFLAKHPDCNGKLGVVGFCFGGGMAHTLAVRQPDLIKAAVPYYGGPPSKDDASKVKAALLIQLAGADTRINDATTPYAEALKAAGVEHTVHIYPNTQHGFHNDTTPRFDEAAAKLSWDRTIDFFKKKLA
jgi:carboxymethylenebutenolidase